MRAAFSENLLPASVLGQRRRTRGRLVASASLGLSLCACGLLALRADAMLVVAAATVAASLLVAFVPSAGGPGRIRACRQAGPHRPVLPFAARTKFVGLDDSSAGACLATPQKRPLHKHEWATPDVSLHAAGVRRHDIVSQYPRMDEPAPEVDPRRPDPDGPPPRTPPRMPVVDVDGGQMDVQSRLLKDRIVLLGKQVDDEIANVIVAQLLYLNQESPDKDITLYINSPGGSVSAGMAIYDTMQFVMANGCDISTVCFGMAASMGAFLLGAGTKGKRKSLPNSRIMIHQPLGGTQGQAADIEIQAKEILFTREVLNGIMSDYTGQPKNKIQDDCDRDFYMTPEEAVEYGLIDAIVKTKTSSMPKPPMPMLEE